MMQKASIAKLYSVVALACGIVRRRGQVNSAFSLARLNSAGVDLRILLYI